MTRAGETRIKANAVTAFNPAKSLSGIIMRRAFHLLIFILAAHITLSAQTAPPALTTKCPELFIDQSDYQGPSFEKENPLTLTAEIRGAEVQTKLTFNWIISDGTILSGQGTRTITVAGFGDSLAVQVEIQGLPQACPNKHSLSSYWCGLRLARRFDQYGDIPLSDEKRRLDLLVAELQNFPSDQAYLIAYGVKPERRAVTEARLDRAKAYLRDKHQIDEGRIVIIYGGYREAREVEVWLVPTGAMPPSPSPTVE